ncbi:hypothetical protein H0H87_003341 [Tephrocybe sp. NHM501043]|nr:hypothetical protein H0H87_003341 [Tephrocybe sp. NHM501043]
MTIDRPDMPTILRDLFALNNKRWLCDGNTGNEDNEFSSKIDPARFLVSFMNNSPCINSLLWAVDIDVSPSTLEGLAHFDMVPMHWGSHHECVFEKIDSSPHIKWTVTLSPAGYISDLASLLDTSSHFLVQIFGRKLWMLWPCSLENLSILGPGPFSPKDTLRAIRELQGIRSFITTEDFKQLVLPPNHFHASISLTHSAHATSRLWAFPFFSAARDMTLKNLKEKMLNSKGDIDAIDLAGWETLVSQHPLHPMAEEVEQFVNKIRSDMNVM